MNHGGHEMPAKCTMNMLWNTQIVDTCIVFSSWHVRTHGQFVVSFVLIVLLGVLFEYLRLFQCTVDARIRERMDRGKRALSPAVESERGEDMSLLHGQPARRGATALALPVHYRVLRAVLCGVSVLLSCFLMLILMTYNAYLIFAVVAGATIGHYLFSGFAEPDGRGMACH